MKKYQAYYHAHGLVRLRLSAVHLYMLANLVFLAGLVLSNIYIHPARAAAGPLNASKVLGQSGFNTTYVNNTAAPNVSGLDQPYNFALDQVHHRLFVADMANYRILVYGLSSTDQISSYSASYVLGQADFSSQSNAACQTPSQTGFCTVFNHLPLAYDGVNDRLSLAIPTTTECWSTIFLPASATEWQPAMCWEPRISRASATPTSRTTTTLFNRSVFLTTLPIPACL